MQLTPRPGALGGFGCALHGPQTGAESGQRVLRRRGAQLLRLLFVVMRTHIDLPTEACEQ